MKVAIVSPCHIQPSDEWISSLQKESKSEGNSVDVIIVDDSNGKLQFPSEWKVFGYDDQKEYLGESLYELFKQFHKSSACKNFGLFYAYKENYDAVIVVDSDCIVKTDFVALHVHFLKATGDGWINPITETDLYSRGFPYSQRGIEKWSHMGLWTNELDLYGKDRVGNDKIPKHYVPRFAYNPAAGFFPMSGMNVSFVREAIPYVLFLPNFNFGDEKFIRHDDIWGGYIFQKFARAYKKGLSFGLPVVYHDTEVNPEEDAKEEEPMIKYEDSFYSFVDVVFGLSPHLDYVFSNLASSASSNGVFARLENAFKFQLLAYSDVHATNF